MPEAEEALRAEIAAYCARLWQRHLVTGSSGNVSARLGDAELLVTPAGRALGSLGPAELVRVALDGTPAAPGRPTSELPLHLAAYAARPDARCVVHTHPTFCVVWSMGGAIFPQDTVGARETLGPVAWTPYYPAGSNALAAACSEQFARGFDAVVMERHGLSTIGIDLERAFLLTDLAEEAARIAFFSRTIWGTPSERSRKD